MAYTVVQQAITSPQSGKGAKQAGGGGGQGGMQGTEGTGKAKSDIDIGIWAICQLTLASLTFRLITI